MKPNARWLGCALIITGCGDASSPSKESPAPVVSPEPPEPESDEKFEPTGHVYIPGSFVGNWRFTLESPGGELPFLVSLEPDKGAIVDQHERLPFSLVKAKGDSLRLELAHYDSVLLLSRRQDDNGVPRYTGTWRRRSPGKNAHTKMSLRAVEDTSQRFDSALAELKPLAGRWQLTFEEEDGSHYSGLADLQTRKGEGGEPWIEGSILTDTGDYRYLEGALENDRLRLSVFDGAHAFLFHATLAKGDLTQGHFWSRDSYHATFEGNKVPEGEASALADPFDIVSVTSDDRRFHFDFPMLGGGRLSQDDPRFAGKVVVAEVFGTWCPNCSDQAPLMNTWYGEYRERGLEMVGIAFEFTGDEREDMDMLGRYARKNAVEHHQLSCLRHRRKRPRLRPLDRAFWAVLSQVWGRWRELLVMVKPATVVGWHRKGFKLFWTWKSRKRGPGRPRIDKDIRKLISEMASTNVGWGAPRIHGELVKLGITVSQSTV